MQLAGLLFAAALACASCAAACARGVAKPEDPMAAIPGGTFAMGSEAEDANEN
jgi:formylglycine-generating enzyme required for sulfatase activity